MIRALCLAVPLAAALFAGGARAQTSVCETTQFPLDGPMETEWSVCVRVVPGSEDFNVIEGLRIGPVHFRPGPGKPLIKIAHDLQVAEIFVPYANNAFRFADISGFGFGLGTLAEADCPAAIGGARPLPAVCRERRDRGLMHRHNVAGPRRGGEVVYWGAFTAANYQYIMEYAFRDDGSVVGRLGATGQNFPGQEFTAHGHSAFWRIDLDLAGTVPNVVRRIAKTEPCATVNPPNANLACETATAVTTASSHSWSATQHTMLEVSNPNLKNARGQQTAYRLLPLALAGGLGQHAEAWTKPDFWVTRYQQNGITGRMPTYLPQYISGAPSLVEQDIVLWVKGSAFHHVRAEDGVLTPQGWKGTTHLMWSGFMLHPHNLFDCTPFFGGCPANAIAAPAGLHAHPAPVTTARLPAR